ncbi:MAG: NUDIX hydrolase [Deltaproteobacteria bacterium]|nr:NUDIX hydrolase [Deltaproteobacteria bacterium]
MGPFPRPAVAVDLVILTVVDTDLKVLLITRGLPPQERSWALPGGFVRVGEGGTGGESLEAAAARELAEETGLGEGAVFLEQLYTYGAPDRDPRGRVISVAWYALVPSDRVTQVVAGSDAAAARWFSLGGGSLPPLAFDHAQILGDAVRRVQGKIDYAPVAFRLVPEQFTVPELRAVYEAVKGTDYDAANFRRRFRRMVEDGLIVPAPGKRPAEVGRPARVWRWAEG